MHVTDTDISFLDGLGMLTVKAAKQVYKAYIYIFIAIALEETSILVAVYFSM